MHESSVLTPPSSPSSQGDPHVSLTNTPQTTARLQGYIFAHRRTLIGGLIAVMVAGVSVLLIGRGLQWLVDYAFQAPSAAQQAHNLRAGVTGLIILGGILAIASFLRLYLLSKGGERVMRDYRTALFRHIHQLPLLTLQSRSSGDLTTRMTADTTIVQSVLTTSLPVAMRNAVMFFGGILMMLTRSGELTLVVILGAAMLLLPVMILGRAVRRRSRAAQDTLGDLGTTFDEALLSAMLARVMGRLEWQAARFADGCTALYQRLLSAVRLRGLLSSSVISIILLAIACVLWRGGQAVIQNELTPGTLAAFVFYAIIVASSAGGLADIYGEVLRALAALSRLEELFLLPLVQPQAAQRITPVQTFSLRSVSYTYPNEPLPALQDISLTLKRGETTALVGPSGGGKSTLIKLLLGHLAPGRGEIQINARSAAPQVLYGHIGYVPQESVMLSGSVRENITFGMSHVSEVHLRQVLDLVCAQDFVNTLPQGLETHLGPRGLRLSGGQRQRIALARALLARPQLLILDEATAALDNTTEARIYESIRRYQQECITVIAAHRLSTIDHAAQIIVLNNGKITEQGTHEALIHQNGIYAQMAQREALSRP